MYWHRLYLMVEVRVPAVVQHAERSEARGESGKPPSHLLLRAIAFPDGGGYLAECIDLNLMVRRESMEEATQSLESAIAGYFQTVADDPSARSELTHSGRVRGLVPRPSPLIRRFNYHFHCLLAALQGNERNFQLREYSSTQFAHC